MQFDVLFVAVYLTAEILFSVLNEVFQRQKPLKSVTKRKYLSRETLSVCAHVNSRKPTLRHKRKVTFEPP